MRVRYATDALDDYMAELGTLGLAPRTVRCQSGFLRRLRQACEAEARDRGKRSPLTMDEIDSKVIARYFADAKGGAGNRNNMLIPARKWLEWCEAGGLIPYGSAARILSGRKYLKTVRQPKYYIPASDFPAMLEFSGRRHPEDRAVVALGLYTLGRSSEITGLRLRDVDLGTLTLQMYRDKTSRWTPVGICPELADELPAWLDWYAFHAGCGTDDLPRLHPGWRLIPRLIPLPDRGERGYFTGTASRFGVDPENQPMHLERVVKRALDHLGVEGRQGRQVRHLGEGMHTFRRSAARAMLDHLTGAMGYDGALLRVSAMLDHEDVRQTLTYISMDVEKDRLNAWLRTSSPFGTARPPENVVSIAQRHAGARMVPTRHHGNPNHSQAV